MARRHAILSEENFPIPGEAYTYEGFLRWVESDEFPESGRIDFLAGEIEADMCSEAIDTHGSPKVEIVVTLGELVLRTGLGDLQTDTTRFNSTFAAVSTEPDVIVVLRESLESGRVRLAPSVRKDSEKIMAFEGPVDLIVEIVSDSSVSKDLKRLPELYARAGVRELWQVDARGKDLRFDVLSLQGDRYAVVTPDAEGWRRSPVLGRPFRLVRYSQPPFPWRYRLEHKDG
jgi:Uma2 family endonuclease